MNTKPVNDCKKKRKDCFFGIHFDFHARNTQTNIGATADPALIERMISTVKPDFIQCDTKGHFGISSYPTKVGHPAPDFHSDILKMWREITEKFNVALFAHHSGLWEEAAAQDHPEWAAYDENGKISAKLVSTVGGYAEGRLIPQLLELANDYGLDGVWLDGDVWCVLPDYSPTMIDLYKAEYGRKPPKSDDRDYSQYLHFARNKFREYVKKYYDAVKTDAPRFEICSNGLYSSRNPEKPNLPVDFISSDLPLGMQDFRFEPRCYMQRALPWDVMSWAFACSFDEFNINGEFYYTTKELNQLCQEAAFALSLGGSYQFVNHPVADTTYEWAIDEWARLADFCRARKEVCWRAAPVPQAAIYCSSAAYYSEEVLFGGIESLLMRDARGLLFAMLDNQYSTELIMTNHVTGDKRLSDYGVIMLPNTHDIEPEAKNALLKYAESGGSLVLTGPDTLKLFQNELGICINGYTENDMVYLNPIGHAVGVKTHTCDFELISSEYVSDMYHNIYLKGRASPAVIERILGSGKLIGVNVCFEDYFRRPTAGVRHFAKYIAQRAYPHPTVKVAGSNMIELSLMRKNGKLCVNLINLGGLNGIANGVKTLTYDEIPPLYSIALEIVCPTPPAAVFIEPGHTPAQYAYRDGVINMTLEKLEIHSVVTIE